MSIFNILPDSQQSNKGEVTIIETFLPKEHKPEERHTYGDGTSSIRVKAYHYILEKIPQPWIISTPIQPTLKDVQISAQLPTGETATETRYASTEEEALEACRQLSYIANGFKNIKVIGGPDGVDWDGEEIKKRVINTSLGNEW